MKPETEEMMIQPAGNDTPRAASVPYTILVAEDDFEMRRLLVWSLKKAEFEVIECQDGTSLMKKLGLLGPPRERPTIDLVISDIRMPGVTGLQVLENAQEMNDAPPIILISAFADRDAFDQAGRLGAATLLPKPFEMDELLNKVKENLPLVNKRSLHGGEPQSAKPNLPFTLEVTFRHGSGSEPVKEFVEELAQKMTLFGEYLLHCRVVIDVRNGNGSARQWPHVGLVISTKGGPPIVVERESSAGSEEENLYLALHTVFSTAYRRLKQKYRKGKSHVDKKHQTWREDY